MTRHQSPYGRVLGLTLDPYAGHKNYPPYNIIMEEDNGSFVIEVAVAGFHDDDILVKQAENILSISTNKDETDDIETVKYIHKGVSTKAFNLEFLLGEYYEVNSARMLNGLLTIKISKNLPEHLKPRQIDIETISPQPLLEK